MDTVLFQRELKRLQRVAFELKAITVITFLSMKSSWVWSLVTDQTPTKMVHLTYRERQTFTFFSMKQ